MCSVRKQILHRNVMRISKAAGEKLQDFYLTSAAKRKRDTDRINRQGKDYFL